MHIFSFCHFQLFYCDVVCQNSVNIFNVKLLHATHSYTIQQQQGLLHNSVLLLLLLLLSLLLLLVLVSVLHQTYKLQTKHHSISETICVGRAAYKCQVTTTKYGQLNSSQRLATELAAERNTPHHSYSK